MAKSEDERLAEEWAAALGEDPNAPDIDVDEILAAPLEELKNTAPQLRMTSAVSSIPLWIFR